MIERTVGQIAQMIDAKNDVSQYCSTCRLKGCDRFAKSRAWKFIYSFKGEQADGHQYVERALKRGAIVHTLAPRCAKPTGTCAHRE